MHACMLRCLCARLLLVLTKLSPTTTLAHLRRVSALCLSFAENRVRGPSRRTAIAILGCFGKTRCVKCSVANQNSVQPYPFLGRV